MREDNGRGNDEKPNAKYQRNQFPKAKIEEKKMEMARKESVFAKFHLGGKN
jgi:hypothetical protein